MHFFAQTFDIILIPFANFGSIFYTLWAHKTYFNPVFNYPNIYEREPGKKIWIFIEIYIFFGWVVSSMGFMAWSFVFRQRGLWREKKIH